VRSERVMRAPLRSNLPSRGEGGGRNSPTASSRRPPSGVISQAEGEAAVGVRGVGGEQLSGRPPPAHMLRQPQRGARGGAAAGQRPGIAGRQGSGWAAGGTARYCARLWGARHRRCSKTPGSGRGRFPRRAPGHACMLTDMQCIFTRACRLVEPDDEVFYDFAHHVARAMARMARMHAMRGGWDPDGSGSEAGSSSDAHT